MTVIEAINAVDRLKPNMYEAADKVEWLSRLDRRIWEQIIRTHEYNEGEEEIECPAYTEADIQEGATTELLIGEPYDEIYIHWLSEEIDYYNMEYDGFNASNAMFESVFNAFRDAYNRSHMPKGAEKKYF